MTNHFVRMRNMRRERAEMKIDFLSSVDTTGMTVRDRKVHEALQSAIARRDELEESMHDIDLSDEERGRLFEEMRKTDAELRDLGLAERDSLLRKTAEAMGLAGADSAELVETIKDVFEATDFSRGGMHPRR